MEYIEIHWTCANLEEARKVSKELVECKLVACANLFPRIESIYFWENKLQQEEEVKIFFKTLPEFFKPVLNWIKEHSSYETPEVSCIDIKEANPAYVAWLKEQLQFS